MDGVSFEREFARILCLTCIGEVCTSLTAVDIDLDDSRDRSSRATDNKRAILGLRNFFWSSKSISAAHNEAHNQERLAIVAALTCWRRFVQRLLQPIDMLSEHHNLKAFMKSKVLIL